MEINKWYKQSEVGVIPQDWQVMQLKDIASYRRGSFPQPYGLSKWYDEVLGKPFIQVFDVENNQLKLKNETKKHISAIAEKMSVFAEIGSVVVTINGSVGRIALTQYEGFIDRTLLIFEEYKVPLVKKYFIYALYVLFQIEKEKAPGAILRTITKEHLSGFYLPLPPLPEQHAIAEALSDMDALIAVQEALITKKRAVKQGVMQELLTGKRRLPGFSEEWEVKKLKELVEIRSGGTPSTTQVNFWGGDILWCTPTDITALNGYKYLKNTNRTISDLGLKNSSAEIIPSNSVIMTSRATIGECVINKLPVTTNQGFKNFIPFENVDVEFLYYLLATKKTEFISLSSGSTFLEINKAKLLEVEVCFPKTLDEQAAIATILIDLDTEIDGHKQKLDKTHQIKQGMMQELLTGRIRLTGV